VRRFGIIPLASWRPGSGRRRRRLMIRSLGLTGRRAWVTALNCGPHRGVLDRPESISVATACLVAHSLRKGLRPTWHSPLRAFLFGLKGLNELANCMLSSLKRLIPKPLLSAYHWSMALLAAAWYHCPSKELVVIA